MPELPAQGHPDADLVDPICWAVSAGTYCGWFRSTTVASSFAAAKVRLCLGILFLNQRFS